VSSRLSIEENVDFFLPGLIKKVKPVGLSTCFALLHATCNDATTIINDVSKVIRALQVVIHIATHQKKTNYFAYT
jgi:hypothetical protein